jgi:hypothetical protein
MKSPALPDIVDKNKIENLRPNLFDHEKQLFHCLVLDLGGLGEFYEKESVPLDVDHFRLAIDGLTGLTHPFLHKVDQLVEKTGLSAEFNHHFFLVGLVQKLFDLNITLIPHG